MDLELSNEEYIRNKEARNEVELKNAVGEINFEEEEEQDMSLQMSKKREDELVVVSSGDREEE